MLTSYAKLTRQFLAKSEHRSEDSWTDIDWLPDETKASRLPHSQALWLIEELRARTQGVRYEAARDKTGEANLPPYGPDNWIVKRIGSDS
jgi:hypothetical protein